MQLPFIINRPRNDEWFQAKIKLGAFIEINFWFVMERPLGDRYS